MHVGYAMTQIESGRSLTPLDTTSDSSPRQVQTREDATSPPRQDRTSADASEPPSYARVMSSATPASNSRQVNEAVTLVNVARTPVNITDMNAITLQVVDAVTHTQYVMSQDEIPYITRTDITPLPRQGRSHIDTTELRYDGSVMSSETQTEGTLQIENGRSLTRLDTASDSSPIQDRTRVDATAPSGQDRTRADASELPSYASVMSSATPSSNSRQVNEAEILLNLDRTPVAFADTNAVTLQVNDAVTHARNVLSHEEIHHRTRADITPLPRQSRSRLNTTELSNDDSVLSSEIQTEGTFQENEATTQVNGTRTYRPVSNNESVMDTRNSRHDRPPPAYRLNSYEPPPPAYVSVINYKDFYCVSDS